MDGETTSSILNSGSHHADAVDGKRRPFMESIIRVSVCIKDRSENYIQMSRSDGKMYCSQKSRAASVESVTMALKINNFLYGWAKNEHCKKVPSLRVGYDIFAYHCKIAVRISAIGVIFILPSGNVNLCRRFLRFEGLSCLSGEGVLVRLCESVPSPFSCVY